MAHVMIQHQGHCKQGDDNPNLPEQGEFREVEPPPPTHENQQLRCVHHTYLEYSTVSPTELRMHKKALTNFPGKMHQILSTSNYSHIISWMPHGRAWKIHNRKLLAREVIPGHFAQSKYESFTRQLNSWGFKRLHQSGNDCSEYYHECFLRGLPHLTALMVRATSNLGKQIRFVEGEPNFYEIDKQYPLPALPDIMPHHGHES